LLFAAETTGALVVPTPPGLFSFLSIWYQCACIMKTLFLLRHAKAENSAAALTDPSRALNERGRIEAQAVGTFLKKQNLKLDLVLCSTAVRARETTELVLAAAEVTTNVRYDGRIYEASPLRLLEVIAEIEDDRNSVLLVGHNPGMEELLQLLTGRAERMATAALAKIELHAGEWSSVREDMATLDWIVKPGETSRSPTVREGS
jgi:phosphohistidine phosphatase